MFVIFIAIQGAGISAFHISINSQGFNFQDRTKRQVITLLSGYWSSGALLTSAIAGILVAILAPMAAGLIQMSISRAREYEADRGGAEIAQDPEALASALEKIHRYASGIPFDAVEHHPETAQMMIMNPLTASGLSQLFSTHPATEDRVSRLMEMARTGTYPA